MVTRWPHVYPISNEGSGVSQLLSEKSVESRKCEWIQARHDSGLPVTRADKKADAHCSRFQPDGRGHLSTRTAASCPTMGWALRRVWAAREKPDLSRLSSSGHTDPRVGFGGSLSTGMTGGGFVTNPGRGMLTVDEPLSLETH